MQRIYIRSISFPLLVLLEFAAMTCLYGISGTQQGMDERVGVDRIVFELQHRHGIQVFYRPEWFEGKSFHSSLTGQGLAEVVDVLARVARLEALFFDGILVFIPLEGTTAASVTLQDRQIVIGDPNEFGRYSRATVSGQILDGASGEPLVGAVVFETAVGRGASTDGNGRFTMELPVGEHTIRLSYIGYEDAFYDIRLISSGQALFELFGSTAHLDMVTITARRARENILGTRMSRIEMDAIMIRELPQSFGERDVVRSMTMLPGVQTIGELGTGFNVRGGSADQNLILVENVPLFNSSHLFGLISVVNPDLVSDITLMKAGIPARYGERASSVMDIKLGNGTASGKTTLTGGIGIVNSRLLFQTPVVKEKASLSLAARSSYSDWLLRRIPAEDLMNSSAGFHDLTVHSQVSMNKNNMVTLFGYYSHDRFGFSGNASHQYANTLLSARWNSYLNNRLSSAMIAGWSRYDHQVSEHPVYNTLGHFSIQSDIDYKTLKWYLTWLPDRQHVAEAGINLVWYGISPGHRSPLGPGSLIEPAAIDRERALERSQILIVSRTWPVGLKTRQITRYNERKKDGIPRYCIQGVAAVLGIPAGVGISCFCRG